MKSKVYFSKSGSGSISGRVTIPKAYLNILKINELESEIDIDIENGKITIEKVQIKELVNVSYDDMLKFILNNVEYTYNVAQCLNEFIGDMGEGGLEEGEFFMTQEQEHFLITSHFEIKNEDTEDEEIIYTYDVKIL